MAVDSIYHLQSHEAIVVKFDKDIHFTMKTNLSAIQQQRLFVDKVPFYAPGFQAEMYEEDHKKYMRVFKNVNQ